MAFIGIDLGTTFSAIAVIDESGNPKIIHNKDGRNVTASCVAEQDGAMEIGELAQRTWGEFPGMAAARFKRSMGTSKTFSINGSSYTPTDLSALVISKLVKDAQDQIGKIEEAVITIPANFAHEAREATIAAAKMAGLNVKFIINEPTAAALYYAFKNGAELNGNYAVYDLGGGTFDISVIRAHGHEVEVIASNGVSKLGGDDFDAAIVALVQKKYKELRGEALSPTDFTKNDAEVEKKALSSRGKAAIKVNGLSIEISRHDFEASISSFLAQAEMLCESTVEEANLKMNDLSGVFLVGGSTRIPSVKESVKRIFKREPESTINVDEVVALGAAVYAAYKGDKSKLTIRQKSELESVRVSERTSQSFGTLIRSYDSSRGEDRLQNSVIINKGEKIPCSVTSSFFTVEDNQTTVSCSVTEAVAPETDPRFVKIVWTGNLALPPGRPKDQEIRVTFEYDENQVMKCSFVDVATGSKTDVDLSITKVDAGDVERIKRFKVE